MSADRDEHTDVFPQSGKCQVEIEKPDTNDIIALTVVPQFKPGSSAASIPRSPEGSPGKYRITFVLGIPGKQLFQENLQMDQLLSSGESLLEAPKGKNIEVSIIRKDKDSAEVRFLKSKTGALARAQVHVTANSVVDAEQKAHAVVLPTLSWLSYLCNAPLDFTGFEVFEERTETCKWSFRVLGKRKLLELDVALPAFVSTPAGRVLLSSYREGLNATHPFHSFLCFFKVAEAIQALRKQRHRKVKRPRREAVGDSELIPAQVSGLPAEAANHVESFKPFLGNRFDEVVDSLRDVMRNAIVHLVPKRKLLVSDNYVDVARCQKVLPIIRYIARQMLANEIGVASQTLA